jgi:hypothetical protein
VEIQTKLPVNTPGDVYEQEADRAAAQVVRKVEPSRQRIRPKIAPPNGGQQILAPLVVHEVLRSAGRPLDAHPRNFFNARFGHDFSHVRVHDSREAAHSAEALGASAYTVGADIVFGHGQYAPDTAAGRALLAHELVHVVQQEAGAGRRIQRQALMPPDPNHLEKCRTLLGQIKEAVATLIERANDLINDPLGLQWDNWTTPKILPGGRNVGSVVGHQQQYLNWRTRLQNLLRQWDDDDCNSTGLRVPREVREWAFKRVPEPTPRLRPDTEPKPWEGPGVRRVAAAASLGAAIGAAAGLIVGAVGGAIGGAAGGTLVAPGVGTVGGGAAGAIAGAEAGAPVGAAAGAAAGAAIGGLIEWLTSPI